MSQRYIKLSYRMFTNSAASHKLLYETEVTKPVAFVTDMGLMIEAFEQRVSELRDGESFDFTLQPAEAFGERDEDLVRAVPRKVFEVRGRFIEEEVYPGAEVPLMDNEGNQFQGTIVKVTDTEVTVDLNNPLAGKALQFTGTVYENREPTRDEMNKMKEILDKALKQGAAGLSSGLWYLPGKYSKTEEVVELASVLKGTNKPYATHMRSEGDGLLESIDEAMKVAAAGANRLEISHFKTSNKRNWNKLDAAFEKIEEGKRNGMTIFADRYPYIFSCTSLRMVVPAPYDLIANIREFLQTPEHQKEIIQAFEKLGDKGPNWERVIVTDSGVASHKPYIGNNMKENAEMMGLTPPEATIKLLSEGTPQGAFGKMSEENMHRILAKDWVVAGSDASANAYDYTVGRAHPRAFGTFPRFFQFARESAPDEQVIRRMTSLTASMFNIPERGVIKPGYRADLVLFDPDNFQCVFDFKAPHTPCTGVRFVFVNGKLAFDADDPTSRGRHGSFVPIH